LSLDGLNGNGDFIWAKWLLKMVKSGRRVVLLSSAHSPEHYEALFKKNMLDLRLGHIRNKVKMKYIVPGSLSDGLIGKEEMERVSAANEFYSCAHYDWESLEKWISECLNGNDEGERDAIFIDDLSTFEALAPSKASARKMIGVLLSSFHTPKKGPWDLLVAKGSMGWADFEDEAQKNVPDNEVEPSLTEVCKYRASYTVRVVPLSTGFSNDVHGIVKFTGTRAGLMIREEYTWKNVNPNTVSFTKLM